MAMHFLSVLGTSNYEPVNYFFGDESDSDKDQNITSFVQQTLLRHFYSELMAEKGKVTIFLTNGARKSNWEDRSYSDSDKRNMQKWPEKIRPETSLKEGLYTQIQKNMPDLLEHIETVDIPDGKSESEIWEIFQKIYGCLSTNDSIVFDITHSFRSIPMLAITAINYARVISFHWKRKQENNRQRYYSGQPWYSFHSGKCNCRSDQTYVERNRAGEG